MLKKALILAGKDTKLRYRDRAAVAGGYVAPVLILIIFGFIYSGMGSESNSWNIDLMVVDQADSVKSKSLLENLEADTAFNIIKTTSDPETGDEIPLTEELVKDKILRGKGMLGLIYHGETVNPDFPVIGVPSMTLYYSPSAGIERQVTAGLLQKAVFMSLGTDLPKEGTNLMLRELGLENSPAGNLISSFMNQWVNQMGKQEGESADGESSGELGSYMESMIDLKQEEVVNEEVKRGDPFMANSVSGIIVMFLLFSVSYAGASLLQERDAGTIRRLLMAPMTIDSIILGKFISIAFNSLCQLTLMLLVASLIFKVNVLGNIVPVIIISLATIAAVTAFGMILSAVLKTYDQVTSATTVVVLVMSAVGGSMFPRILMPDWMQKFGFLTINGWAIDGYLDALYYYNGPGSMLGYAKSYSFIEFIENSEALVLFAFAIICSLIAARIFRSKLVAGD